ncbi:hypothetical protein AB0D11_46835 [Streptomyces monashensis]
MRSHDPVQYLRTCLQALHHGLGSPVPEIVLAAAVLTTAFLL